MTRAVHLEEAWDWKILADVGQQLLVPPKIVSTSQRLDLVLWSSTLQHCVFCIDRPWEDAVEEANEKKRFQYAEMAVDAQQKGKKALVHLVEIGSRGIVATLTIRLLKELGIHCQTLHQTIKEKAATTEHCSQWLWIRRKDLSWAPR